MDVKKAFNDINYSLQMVKKKWAYKPGMLNISVIIILSFIFIKVLSELLKGGACSLCKISSNLEIAECGEILCTEHFATHITNCTSCNNKEKLVVTNMSAKWSKALEIIKGDSKHNFLVFHDWIEDNIQFAAIVDSSEDVKAGIIIHYFYKFCL